VNSSHRAHHSPAGPSPAAGVGGPAPGRIRVGRRGDTTRGV